MWSNARCCWLDRRRENELECGYDAANALNAEEISANIRYDWRNEILMCAISGVVATIATAVSATSRQFRRCFDNLFGNRQHSDDDPSIELNRFLRIRKTRG